MLKIPIDIDLKKNDPKTMLLMVLVAAFIFVLYFWLFVQPQLARLTDTLGRFGKVRNELKTAEINVARIEKLQTDVNAFKEKVDNYEKRLPAEQEIPNFLGSISDMARSSNVKIVAITPIPVAAKESKAQKAQIYQEMPILISAKCGYHELGQFLSKLENADRFMKVVDIDMIASKTTPKKHDVELVVSTFILLKEK